MYSQCNQKSIFHMFSLWNFLRKDSSSYTLGLVVVVRFVWLPTPSPPRLVPAPGSCSGSPGPPWEAKCLWAHSWQDSASGRFSVFSLWVVFLSTFSALWDRWQVPGSPRGEVLLDGCMGHNELCPEENFFPRKPNSSNVLDWPHQGLGYKGLLVLIRKEEGITFMCQAYHM